MLTYRIRNQHDYEALGKRVRNGARFMAGKWHDPNYKREMGHYLAMAVAMLNWEIETGVFGEKFDKWMLEN